MSNANNTEDIVEFTFENYIASSEASNPCKACGESFKETWDKCKEAWLLDSAVKVEYEDDGEGKVVNSN